MGQKIHPHGLRVGVIKDWDSRWYVGKKDFGDTLVEDYNLRKMLKEQLKAAGVPKIEIERVSGRVRIHIFCAKPGIVIGQKGAEIEKLRLQCEKKIGKPVSINIVEVKIPDADATLVAESIALQLEKRVSFRRAMKMSIGRAMNAGVYGFAEAHTTYGIVGVKVWIYNGEVLKDKDGTYKRPELPQPKRNDRDRRPRRRNDGERRADGERRPQRREGGNK